MAFRLNYTKISMIQTIKIENLVCVCCANNSADTVNYILAPLKMSGQAIENAARKYGISIVVVGGMDWDNDLTPWPAPGQPSGSADFKGDAAKFYATLVNQVIPTVEKAMGLSPSARDLTGISLSGLFAMWQWMLHDSFRSIASLSGSFWYQGFAQWLCAEAVPTKSGKAYFSLGREEPLTKVVAFKPVADCTQQIINYLDKAGVKTRFDWVPGSHFVDYTPRVLKAFDYLYLGL